MLKIKTFTFNPLGENTYLLYNENNDGIIIDCSCYEEAEVKELQDFLKTNGISLKHCILTHGHFDHLFGLPFIYREYGLKPWIHKEDQLWYDHVNDVCQYALGVGMREALPEIGGYLSEGQTFEIGEDRLKVIYTPGHTQGGVCYYNEKQCILFSGDTLFKCSIGRTDLLGGNQTQLVRSIQEKLLVLPDHVQVFPGHGAYTTIANEKCNNYFLV